MTAIREQTHRFTGQDGTSLFYRIVKPPTERLRIVVSHGLGEHSGRYGHVAETLCPLGCSLWIPDHRGHGRSQGRRGHVNDFDEYCSDLKILVELAGSGGIQRLPLVLLGHSMGGLIALRFAGSYPRQIDGLILSSPLLGLPESPPVLLRALSTVLSTVWPTFSLSNRLDSNLVSHDQGEVSAYAADEHVHDRITARWVTSCMRTLATVQASPELIRGPLLLQVAGADRLVSTPATLAFFDRITADDKTLHRYDNLYHEIYNEKPIDRKRVLDDLREWVVQRYMNASQE